LALAGKKFGALYKHIGKLKQIDDLGIIMDYVAVYKKSLTTFAHPPTKA
jgi:hypothetical protein